VSSANSVTNGAANRAVTRSQVDSAPPRRAGRRDQSGRSRARRRRQLLAGTVMLAPFVVLVGALLGWPVVWTFMLSFTNEELTGPTALHHKYIGFANFTNLLTSSAFLSSLWHSIEYLVGSAYIGQVVLGFVLALLLRRCNRRVQAIVGAIVIMSWIVPEVIAAFMWFALLGQGGVIQEALHSVGINYSTILDSHPILSLNLANAWRGVAFSMMLYMAALTAIPKDIIEAAMLDGASAWRRIVRIILPLIKGSILVDTVLVTLATLNDFTLIFALTGGGPGDASQVLSTYMYQQGFVNYQIAYGTAVSVILLLVGVVLSIVYVRALRRS
jgi:multiple sugar transport system permease protein